MLGGDLAGEVVQPGQRIVVDLAGVGCDIGLDVVDAGGVERIVDAALHRAAATQRQIT
jgi:hypothetical protein